MRRCCLTMSLAVSLVIGGGATAHAGGTAVLAPDVPTGEDCAPGSQPRIEGAPIEVFVLGCVRPPGSELVITAAQPGGQFACLYVAPPGGRDLSVWDQGRGPLTPKVGSPSARP